jgi:hypothetical protein
MTIHDALAIHRVLERAGIDAKVVELSGVDRAEIWLLGTIAFDRDDVMEAVRENYPDDAASCERLGSEIEASTTLDHEGSSQ